MIRPRLTVSFLSAAGVALMAATLLSGSATAMPPRGWEPPHHCPVGSTWDGDQCVRRAPVNNPFGDLNLAAQATTLDGIHVVGWAADADTPTQPISVRISIDGSTVSSPVANSIRQDVGAVFPAYGPAHGFDLTIPASNGPHTVCATGVNVGSGGDTSLKCVQMDAVANFQANSIDYALSRAAVRLLYVDQSIPIDNANNTSVQQSTTVSGSMTEADTHGWSTTLGVTISSATQFGASFFGLVKGTETITVAGSANFTTNGSETITKSFGWSQPIIVPARSMIRASVTIGRYSIDVPFTLSGNFVYKSGTQVAGTVSGIYHGVESPGVNVRLDQFNLDGTPSAVPAPQPLSQLRVDVRNNS